MTLNMDRRIDFFSLLTVTERSPEIPESADVYGWLCGSWDLDVLHYRGMDVTARGLKGRSPRGTRARGAGRPGRVDHASIQPASSRFGSND
jgi:hypothetical protein